MLISMKNDRLRITASNISKSHSRTKRGWTRDAMSWLNHWGILEEDALRDINIVKRTIITKFKKKMWSNREIENNRKLYYKQIIKPKLEDQNYLFIFVSLRKKINIAKIRTNFHESHSETSSWTTPKTP